MGLQLWGLVQPIVGRVLKPEAPASLADRRPGDPQALPAGRAEVSPAVGGEAACLDLALPHGCVHRHRRAGLGLHGVPSPVLWGSMRGRRWHVWEGQQALWGHWPWWGGGQGRGQFGPFIPVTGHLLLPAASWLLVPQLGSRATPSAQPGHRAVPVGSLALSSQLWPPALCPGPHREPWSASPRARVEVGARSPHTPRPCAVPASLQPLCSQTRGRA